MASGVPSSECAVSSTQDGVCSEGPRFLSGVHARQRQRPDGGADPQNLRVPGPFQTEKTIPSVTSSELLPSHQLECVQIRHLLKSSPEPLWI